MIKLTDAQQILLSKAAEREDGAAIAPEKMPKAAAMKIGASLVAKTLMREIRVKGDMPVWREDEDGRRYSLILTRAGRDAIGVEDERNAVAHVSDQRGKPPVRCEGKRGATLSNHEITAETEAEGATAQPSIVKPEPDVSTSLSKKSPFRPFQSGSAKEPRVGSKQALIIGLLSKESGATIDQLIAATGWLPHTTRAALTGLRKRGFEIERASSTGGGSIYRIVNAGKAAA